VSGTVRRFDRSDVILDLGKFEAIMPQRERVVVKITMSGQIARLRRRGRQWNSRAGNHRLSQSSEFCTASVRTRSERNCRWHGRDRGIAREAGYRTKIAVWSANEKVDPVGACVGMRGRA
jgi:N utilization substance protein A